MTCGSLHEMPSEASLTPPLPFCCPHTPGKRNIKGIATVWTDQSQTRAALVGWCMSCDHLVEHTRDARGQLTGVWVLYE